LEIKKKRSLRSFSSFIIIVLTYLILIVISFLFYPQTFSPLNDTLGQLGNPKLNPTGAIFHNVGIVIVSSPLVLSDFQ
jgi:hypothetical membrane protein